MAKRQHSLLPEEKARENIDRQLQDAGWKVVKRSDYEADQQAQAVCEALTKGNHEADYMLFLNDVAVGVIEAKRADIQLDRSDHMAQVVYYAKKTLKFYKTFSHPLPFVWLANGKEILFRDLRNPDSVFEHRSQFATPKKLARELDLRDEWVALPILKHQGLRNCQYDGIKNLEASFRDGQRRALVVLTTGAGKTYLACDTVYRFLTYTPMRRVLYLVDRNNLARQTEEDFGTFSLTESGDAFNTIYGVERVRNHKFPDDAQVFIATIQGLYAYLRGENVDESDNDGTEGDDEEHSTEGKMQLPPDFFDLIIIDECHRSIYSSWRSVLEYFDSARMIGLTATPGPETLAFFNNNIVENYTYERSVVDKVNVDYRIFRIRTKVTETGGYMAADEVVDQKTNYTGEEKVIRLTQPRNYTPEELNHSVINPSQIRTILEAYRDSVYTDLFPDRKDIDFQSLPKTLIYAINEPHAQLIVDIAREVFHKDDDPEFVQKITYSVGDSNLLIRNFRNDRNFRIAVTVTLVATGTNIKPLEVVMFMRDVNSIQLYQQMVGRGVRTISDDALRAVTPNATSKDVFYIVDAVGVTEHAKGIPAVTTEPGFPIPSLERLLEEIAHGKVDDSNLRLLASRIARIDHKADEEQKHHFMQLSGESLNHIASSIYKALEKGLPPFIDIGDNNTERLQLVASLRNHADARKYLLILNAGFTTILLPGEDALIEKGFSQEEAHETTGAFEEYVHTHKDEIKALQIIYNNAGEPINRLMLENLRQQLLEANRHFSLSQLWNSYSITAPDKVTVLKTKSEKETLTNIIQLVRFAYKSITQLVPVSSYANSLFNLWWGKRREELTDAQIAIFEQVKDYVVSNGSADIQLFTQYNREAAVQLILSFHTSNPRAKADRYIESLSQFIIYNQYNATA